MVNFSGMITSILEDPNENTKFDCDSPFACNSLLLGNELFSYRIQMCFLLLSGNNSPSSWLADVLKKEDVSFLINKFEGGGSDAQSPSGILSQPILRNMQEPFSLPTVMRWMDMFLAALDCYNTFFELRMIKPHEILGE